MSSDVIEAIESDSKRNWQWLRVCGVIFAGIMTPIFTHFITLGIPAHPLAIPWFLTIALPILAFVGFELVSLLSQNYDIKWLEGMARYYLSKKIHTARELLTKQNSISFALSVSFNTITRPKRFNEQKWVQIKLKRGISILLIIFIIQSLLLILFLGFLYGFTYTVVSLFLLLVATIIEFFLAMIFLYLYSRGRRIWVHNEILE